MIALPKGVTIIVGGRTWTGQIPSELYPPPYQPPEPPRNEEPAPRKTRTKKP